MRFSKFTKLVAKSSTKLVFYSVITVTITAVILNLSQILLPLELAIYDFNFLLRPSEPTDERIVVVEWDETSLQSLNETIISDQTLVDLLQRIKKQQPRIIGLDLYRDIPVNSPRLEDEQNIQAHNYLKEVFRTTDNLIGVEKVIEPMVNPPPILSQKDQIAASDIPVDIDRVIRRTYIYPQLNQQGTSTGLPFFGVKLGYEYLVRENFWATRVEHNSLKIFKDKTEIILRPLKYGVGAFTEDKYSFNILINWRKGKPSFRSVSALEVLNNQVSPNFLTDKIVLIGNVSISSADLHNTPIDQPNQSATYGVYVVAQATSSIVNAALEGRSLINPVPKLVVLIFIIISSGTIFYLITKNQELRTVKLYFLTATYACVLTVFLIVSSVIVFSNGYWIPLTTAIGCIWSLYFFVNYYLYKQKEQKRIFLLESFITDFNHNLGNRLASINSSNHRINLIAKEFNNTEDREKIDIITRRTSNINNQILKIERYRDRIGNFIDFSYLNYSNNLSLTNINLFVSNIVAKFLAENEYEYEVCVQQIYDEQLGDAKIDRVAIEIVIENLLDNAFYSVSPRLRANKRSEYCPSVKIKTELINKKINFIVEDNGAGIKKENINKIFEPFVSLRLGQGIGLFLISKIAKIYQGSIKVESEVAKGSKFIFTVPY
jgi:CHASE2 domain-containing sensor protein